VERQPGGVRIDDAPRRRRRAAAGGWRADWSGRPRSRARRSRRALGGRTTCAEGIGRDGFEQLFYLAPAIAAAAPDAAQLITARKLQAVLKPANVVAFGAGPVVRHSEYVPQDFADVNA
jgi:hypothetical protein